MKGPTYHFQAAEPQGTILRWVNWLSGQGLRITNIGVSHHPRHAARFPHTGFIYWETEW